MRRMRRRITRGDGEMEKLARGDVVSVRFGVGAKRVIVASVTDDGHGFRTTEGESYIAPDVTAVIRKNNIGLCYHWPPCSDARHGCRPLSY